MSSLAGDKTGDAGAGNTAHHMAARRSDAAPLVRSSPVFCFNCGAKLLVGGKFCHSCGAPLAGAPPAPASQPQTPPLEGRARSASRADMYGHRDGYGDSRDAERYLSDGDRGQGRSREIPARGRSRSPDSHRPTTGRNFAYRRKKDRDADTARHSMLPPLPPCLADRSRVEVQAQGKSRSGVGSPMPRRSADEERARSADRHRKSDGYGDSRDAERYRDGDRGQDSSRKFLAQGGSRNPDRYRHGDPVRGDWESTRDTGRSREGRGGAAGCRKRSRQ